MLSVSNLTSHPSFYITTFLKNRSMFDIGFQYAHLITLNHGVISKFLFRLRVLALCAQDFLFGFCSLQQRWMLDEARQTGNTSGSWVVFGFCFTCVYVWNFLKNYQ